MKRGALTTPNQAVLRGGKRGIFGGSFNPIHRGHLHIARRARDLFDLTQVHFVLAAYPPHKPLEHLIPLTHRYAMIALATSASESLVPSLMELEPPASPFSIDTLAKFARGSGGDPQNLYFIAGADSLQDVVHWHDSENLLATYNFIFVARAGVRIGSIESLLPAGAASRVLDLRECGPRQVRRRIREAVRKPETFLFILDLRAPGISASEVRDRICSGRHFAHLVPSPVQAYIHKLHLYGAPCQTR